MSSFPTALDDDSTIIRIDDNVTELAGDAINMLRDAIFKIEANLGLTFAGSLSSGSARFDISHNSDGTIKASALTSVGLITLPITNIQVGAGAGILESKLALDFSTSNLNTLIQANSVLLASLSAFEAALEVKVNAHIAGGPASNLRHVLSQIDVNAHPVDSRDPGFTWGGLIDKDGYQLSGTNLGQVLDQINTNLTSHQNQVTAAHPASAISVDASDFSELLTSSTNVQEVLENIDDIELLQLGTHRATQHTNGIPKAARSLNLSSATTLRSDGYNLQVVDPTPCETFVIHNPPGNGPLDNINTGDSIVSFKPTSNTGSVFDAKFSQVKIGDIIRINYGTIEDLRRVESIRYVPGVEWVVRINGVNLADGYGSFARIDRPLYDSNVYGVLAVAAANAVPLANYSILGSAIIGDPRGATAFGMNFDANKLGPANYNLYLELYSTGNPADHVIKLPAIDVTGNAGITQGKYTLDNVVIATNNAFRATGYNYRFIAFGLNGNFGVMLADSIDGASFAIINGSNSTGSLTESTYVKNVVGDVYGLHYDAFGFGVENANLASPTYQASWIDATAAQFPTKIIHPVKSRNYIVNGRPFDQFKPKDQTINGFWVADIDSKNITGISVEVTYKVSSVLLTAGLKAGKTILVQPAVGYGDALYNDVDYGRFIIKEVVFNNCHCVNDYTLITVINGIHGTTNPLSSSAAVGLPVRLYFGEDSVSFDDQNIIDSSDNSINYHRFHELYITDEKTTFSHERARMVYTSETGQLVDTTNWHIISVSPKFRGYKDLTGTAFNKFIRLFFNNFNATSGEFDGYLGERDLSSNLMLHAGPVVRGRKNSTVRFYDDTNVDYIELMFKDDTTAYPGLSLPTNKWIDIEIFGSLLLDQELLPMASCEVNWNPAVGKNVVEFVRNLKQYGSISESEFTQSAVDFISSGERYLHGNGVVSGFSAEVNLGMNQFLLNGGIALVNGKFVSTNNLYIKIPLITDNTAPPQTIDWAICVDDNGSIKYYPLSVTKLQFFARDAVSAQIYYVSSFSFTELMANKNLTILYIINVTVSSGPVIVYNSYSDARKFVKNETNSIPLTWAGKGIGDLDINNVSEISGHFNTLDQVKTWINWTKTTRNIIKIKGTINSAATIDLSGINFQTVFDGEEGGSFNLNNPRGLILGSNTVLKNIDFNWTPGTLTYAANDNVNLDTTGIANSDNSNACIYSVVNDGQILKNVEIENCTFTGVFTQTQRPPYIAIIISGDNLSINNIKIINNQFIDSSSVLYQCAIAIAVLGQGNDDSTDPLLANCIIENNTANNYQSIILSMLAANTINGSSFNCINTFVSRNNVGAIGYLITDNFTRFNTGTDVYKNPYGTEGLRISDNTALFIGSLETTGHILDPVAYKNNDVGSGEVSIINNFCSIIYCTFFPTFGGGGNENGETLLISENKVKGVLRAADVAGTDLEGFEIDPTAIYGLNKANFTDFTAIYVDGLWQLEDTIYDTRVVQIINNVIAYFKLDTGSSFYDTAIYVDSCAAIINGNIIKSFINNGIVYVNNINRTNFVKVDIQDNQIYNNILTATSYISAADGNSTKFVNVTIINNSFDTYQTNGNMFNMITVFGLSANSVVKNNTNQTDLITLRAQDIGKLVFPFVNSGNNIYKDPLMDSTKIFLLNYGATSGFMPAADPSQQFGQLSVGVLVGGGLSWVIPITLINKDVKFVSASIRYQVYALGGAGDIKNLSLSLAQKNVPDDIVLTSNVAVTATSASGIITITATDPINPISILFGYYLIVHCDLDVAASVNAFIYFSDLIFTFRY